MKKSLLGLLSILVLLSCVEDEKNSTTFPLEADREIKTTKTLENPLADLSDVETQVFDLGLVTDSLLIGKDGTLIYFERDRFRVDATTPLTLNLEEYYQFKDLITHQLSTETVDGKLLSSSGVIHLEVTDGTQEISLKENATLPVTFPDHRIYNNDIYYGVRNEQGIMQWEKDTSLFDTTLLDYQYKRLYGVDEYFLIKVPRDSLDYYLAMNKKEKELYDKETDRINRLYEQQKILYEKRVDSIHQLNEKRLKSIRLQKTGYINIDTEFKVEEWISFQLIDQTNSFDSYLVEIFYQDFNTLLCRNFYDETNLVFDSIPKTGKTFAIVSAKRNDELYAEKIFLEDHLKKHLQLKKIHSPNEFYNLFKSISARDSSENPAVER
ncbi:hypothetical protein [Mesonia sp.]|uniref:hypothetical protein n=1 Tax=Mesonia sp. TaxID=1960830 RepID=UPI001751BE89|nr:hypothetical protein [Mesonia sp.]HIB37530.1 hypothetical protein [Mesonia sp.]HIO27788.1 hypothetical protein [Flavobacteriaceae bacterium]